MAAITEYSISDWVEISYSTPDPEVFTVNTCAELDDLDQLGNHLDTYLLGTDIDFSGYAGFTPLDWGSDFGGTFDGQGYSISNLNILVIDSGHVGLFSSTSNALLQNLTIDDATILGTEDSYYCGALAGYTRNTNIYNVEVHDLSITCSETVGGVVGRFESEDSGVAEVENVSVSGDVIAEGTEVDYGWGPYIEGGYIAGGLFGRADASYEGSVIISQSFSNATVVADSSRAGGIIGEANSEIEEDTNIPTTLLVQDSYSTGSVTGGYNVGGIFGAMEAYNDGYHAVSEIEIENAYSSATVIADYSAGGIVGYMDDPYEEGEQYVLNNVFAVGAVTADDLDYALIGSDDGLGDGSLVINNSYFDQTATGQSEASAYDSTVSGWTVVNTDGSESDYFKNNSSNPPLDQWDFEGVWLTRETDYPILQWNPFSEETDDSDLNGDEIPDSEQPNIGGYISPITNKLVAIDVGEQCELTTDDMTTEANLSVQDPAYEYENGLWDFEADCGTLGYTTTIKLYYYNIDKSNLILRKHNPTTKAFFNINDAVISSQTIGGQNVTVVTYQVTDGGERDIDGIADGMINDPAGLARSLVGAPNSGIR